MRCNFYRRFELQNLKSSTDRPEGFEDQVRSMTSDCPSEVLRSCLIALLLCACSHLTLLMPLEASVLPLWSLAGLHSAVPDSPSPSSGPSGHCELSMMAWWAGKSGLSTWRNTKIAAVSILRCRSARCCTLEYLLVEKVNGDPVTLPACADSEGCMNHFLPAPEQPANLSAVLSHVPFAQS